MYTHIYISLYIYREIYMLPFTHTYTQTSIPIYTNICLPAQGLTHMYIHNSIHIYTNIFMLLYTSLCTHAHIYKYIHKSV